MRDKLEGRLESLKSEYESGQKMMAELEAKQSDLRDTLLRIIGAIQVLEEELAPGGDGENGHVSPSMEIDGAVAAVPVSEPA